MENLKIEAEKGFRRTLFDPELVDPNPEINFDDRFYTSSDVMNRIKSWKKGSRSNDPAPIHKEVGGNL